MKTYITENCNNALYTISSSFTNVLAGKEPRNNLAYFDYKTDGSGNITANDTVIYV